MNWDDENIRINFQDEVGERVSLAIAQAVARVLPRMVEKAVAVEMTQVFEDVERWKEAVHAWIDAGEAAELTETIQRSYALHLARVAAASGVGMAEYAKIAREEAAKVASQDPSEA